MIASLVRTALQQRLVVVVVAVILLAFGFNAARKLSVDAFPDVTNVQVQIATEAPGRSPEEVERFATVPLEVAMTGLPGLEEMRSLNKPGLSLITLVFTDATDVYFARQLVMERLIEVGARMPEGVVPVLGPVSTGLGEVYQYTLDHPDDGDRQLTEAELTERRIVQDWVVRPLLRSIPGVAEINSQGGYARQYQVLVNPDRLRHYKLTVREVYEAVARNNANSGGGVLPHYAEQYLIRGVGLVRDTISPLLGAAPDPELIDYIEKKALSYPGVLGIHDLMVHDYGPGSKLVSFHIELSADSDVMKSHDLIDSIERDFQVHDHLLVTIHFDPVVTDDPHINELRKFLKEQLAEIAPEADIHDLRIVPGPTHTNVIFDCAVPADWLAAKDHRANKIPAALRKAVSDRWPDHFCVIQLEPIYAKLK